MTIIYVYFNILLRQKYNKLRRIYIKGGYIYSGRGGFWEGRKYI